MRRFPKVNQKVKKEIKEQLDIDIEDSLENDSDLPKSYVKHVKYSSSADKLVKQTDALKLEDVDEDMSASTQKSPLPNQSKSQINLFS